MDLDQPLGSAGARSLPADALERLRRQAVSAVESGMPQSHVARLFGVSRKTVGNWMRAYQANGELAFRPRRRGRRAGEQLALSATQQAWIVKTIACGPPDDAGLPSLLWTRKALTELIRREFGISLTGGTIDQYLARWDVTNRTGPLAHPDDCEPDTLQVAWTHPRDATGVERMHALIAVNHRGLMFFVASEHPFTQAQLGDFRKRLGVALGHDVRVRIRSWPAPHAELLARWRLSDAAIMLR
ncbi:helix-turn-helix domain-containing protein [Amycolatopsis sp. K13G38]|uniref:Helix-turn-helix domain-containing protein n=2 Tax=Amycolatopsis acididurans TaxID=2724524 RepID=A0ABX1JCC8_9PSEU|nr:helix-turn-helix domain-containing protein [Amycolatopsis acididurans]